MGRIAKTSVDNHNYDVLETPCTVNLKAAQHAVLDIGGGFKVHHLYVECESIKDSLLPLDANPREPSVTSQVKDMQETLQTAPHDFVKKNNGVTLLCEDITINDAANKCEVVFAKNEGVCNGGHTYFAIVTTNFLISPQAQVHLELMQLPPHLPPERKLEEIIKIARARNNNNRLSLRSEADYLGYYDHFKQLMVNPAFVSWHEGDSAAFEDALVAEHFIRLLYSLDPLTYFHPIYNAKGDRHRTAVTAVSSLHNSWYERMEEYRTSGGALPLRYLATLANDMFLLRDLAAKSLKHDNLGRSFRITGLYQQILGKEERKLLTDRSATGHKIPPTFEVLLMGLFRTDMWLHPNTESNVDLVGWYVDPLSLWDKKKQQVLEALADNFNDFGQDPKQFIRATAPYTNDLFVLGTGQDPPPPQVVCRVGTRERYALEKDSSVATHWVDVFGPLGLHSLAEATRPEGVSFYRRAQ